MIKKWILHQSDPELVALFSKHLPISSRLAALMVNRGIEDLDEAKQFVSGSLKDLPSPFLMKDMKKAVDRLVVAIERRESITVYGDYDVDGVTATSCLLNFFRELGVPAGYHIPHRLKEGYGLHVEALKEIHQKGGRVVITADCGISNVNEAIAASQLGIDLIITDHHIVPPDLPEAHAVLNPLRKDSDYPDLNLAGVGVVFHLMMALRARLRQIGYFENRHEPNLKHYLDLVALGTIADLVPLRGVNHILVKEGLKVLSERQRVGLRSLIVVSEITKEQLGTYEVAFQLAPRLNAGGRVASAEIGVKLLTTDDEEEALRLSQTLDSENKKRRFLQEEILHQAVSQIEKAGYDQARRSFVLSSPTWHPGVIGIVASKLVEKYHRPACLIAEQEAVGTVSLARGSARGIPALHLLDAFRELKDHFVNFGGHKAAAGFSIERQHIGSFREAFEKLVSQRLSEEDFIPKIKVDMKIAMDEVDQGLLTEIDQLAPFGMGNPEPIFISDGFKVSHFSVVGKSHLKLRLEGQRCIREAIGFQMAQFFSDAAKIKAVLYTPSVNEWQGRRSIQLKLKQVSF